MAAEPHSADEQPGEIAADAAAWLARRDRGFTAEEQDHYFEWLRADPRHGAAVARLEKTWGALDALAGWRPAHSARPNPDLLASPPAVAPVAVKNWAGWRRRAVGALAAVAMLGLGLLTYQSTIQQQESQGTVRVILPPERLTLADGTVVDLNHGGKIETDFTAELRRVRLVSGEAHFTVAKNPARPFVVETEGVAVRAVGTAFGVRRASGEVEVLVTEGKVQVERPVVPRERAAQKPESPPTPLVAGERAVVHTAAPERPPVVAAVCAQEISRALAWQGVRLEFAALPLAQVVAEFNLRNSQQLVVGDAATGRLRVGGSFRADHVEAFVRLLEASFGVVAERRADGALELRRSK